MSGAEVTPLLTLPRGDGDELRFEWIAAKGRPFVEVRAWYRSGFLMYPSRNQIRLWLHELPRLSLALAEIGADTSPRVLATFARGARQQLRFEVAVDGAETFVGFRGWFRRPGCDWTPEPLMFGPQRFGVLLCEIPDVLRALACLVRAASQEVAT